MPFVRIADQTINLPDPERIPTPRTRAALEKALDIEAKRGAAFRARDEADTLLRELTDAEPSRLGRAMAGGVEPGESPIAAARQAALDTQAHLLAVIAAETFIVNELHEAVAADQARWSASAVSAGKKAMTKLTTAIRMAQDAYDELHASTGVLTMYRAIELGERTLSLSHARGASHFDIGEGVSALRSGFVTAAHELDQLAPAKPRRPAKIEVPAPLVAADEGEEADPAEVAYADDEDGDQ